MYPISIYPHLALILTMPTTMIKQSPTWPWNTIRVLENEREQSTCKYVRKLVTEKKD